MFTHDDCPIHTGARSPNQVVQNFVVILKLLLNVEIIEVDIDARASSSSFDGHQPSGGGFGVYLMFVVGRRVVTVGRWVARRRIGARWLSSLVVLTNRLI